MTAEIYKKQAARLSEHLSSVHKVRLKHASSLEAIAALHDCRDWNTLCAKREDASSAEQSSNALAGRNYTSEEASALLFARHSFSDPNFCDAVLTQSITLTEGYPGEKQAFVDHLIYRQIQRGGGFLYMGSGNRKQLDRLAWGMSEEGRSAQFRTITPAYPEFSDRFNPLCLRDADSLAAVTMRLLPSTESNPGADFYRQTCNYALTVIYAAMLDLNEPISFQRMAEILFRPEVELPVFLARLPEGKRETLALMIENYSKKTKEGTRLDGEAFRSILGGMAGRIGMLSQGFYRDTLNPETTFTWGEVLENGYGVYLDVGRMGTDSTLERVMVSSFDVGLREHGAHPLRKPFTVFIDFDCDNELVKRLVEVALSRNIGFIRVASALNKSGVIQASISRAGGFGRTAQVKFIETATFDQTSAELEEFRHWPATVPEFVRRGGKSV